MRNFTFLQREFSNTTVKSLFWLTWLLLFGILPAKAQVATNYGFSQLSGTFTPITGGILLGTETTDDQRFLDPAVPAGGTVTTGVGLPIGFDFTFNGQVYNRVAVNANGWISFGNSSLTPAVNNASTSAYTPLASTTATTPTHLRNRISALGADLQAQSGASLRIETIGDAPNRVCVIQWLNYRRYLQTDHNLNFQIRLNETTNIVDIVYGTMTFNSTSNTAHVGLGGSLATDFNNRQTTTNWNSTSAGTTNTASCTFVTPGATPPVSGTTFRWALQSCLSVSSLTASNITPNSATVTWSLSTSNPSNDYQWELRTSGQPGSGATGLVNSGTVSNTTTTANLSGLAPQTEHQFYIRSNCGSEFSSWASLVFTTACAPFVPPTLETFTGTFPPICWSRAQNGTPATGPQGGTVFNWVTRDWRNTANTSNGISAVFNIFSTNRQGWLITPTYNLSSGGFSVFYDVAVTDYFNANPIETDGGNMAIDDEVYFLMSVDDGVTWTTLEIFNQANTPPTAGTTKTYDISTVNSGTVKFAFFATSGPANVVNADYDFFVDNFSVASCLPPTSLITSSLTNSSVNLNWTASVSNPADGYQWEVRTSGAAGSGTTGLVQSGSVGVGITTVAITGLTPSTAYQYYVRSVCSATDNSVWIQGPNFTTLCDLVTEFSQNFDTTTAGTGILPPCWSRSGSSTVANVIGSAAAPFSAPNRLQMSAVFNSTVAYVLMPPVSNLQAETHRLRFKAFATTTGRNIDLGYFTDESDLNTFVLLESIPVPGTTQAIAEELFAFPAGIPTGVSRLVF
ncbi:MAG: fibronectin type III domain-containing protein, partial [Flavobacteriales bacterium]|nr:fibronectin type III domain-containing protein [Flavobacteriales bacterium]